MRKGYAYIYSVSQDNKKTNWKTYKEKKPEKYEFENKTKK